MAMSRVIVETERGPKERRILLMTRKNRSYQRGNVSLHNGVWTLRYRERNRATGKWTTRRERLGEFKHKAAARKAAEPIMARVNECNNTDEPILIVRRMTFKQFVETRWKAYTVKAKHEVSTIYQRDSMLKKHLLPLLGDRFLDEVTPSDISDLLDQLQTKMSATSLLAYYSVLRLLFDLAFELDLIQTNPVRPRMHRPQPEEKEKPTVSPEQIRAIVSHMDAQERLFVLLLGVTGLRLGEGQGLRWQNFNEATGELSITHTLYREKLKKPKTKASQATIRLHSFIVEMLADHRRQSEFQAAGDFIFCRPDGQALSQTSLRRHLYRAMDMVGVNRQKSQYGFHLFRHSAASLLYDKLRDVKQVQIILRHSKVSTTADIYVHPTDAIGAEAAEVLTTSIFGENYDKTVSQTSQMVS
jgi:Site-specific recombinase XerD